MLLRLRLLLFLIAAGTARATPSSSSFFENGLAAQALNSYYRTLKTSDPCKNNEVACIGLDYFAHCAFHSWQTVACSSGLICSALPATGVKNATTIACTTERNALDLIAASGVAGGLTGHDDNVPDSSTLEASSLSPTSFVHKPHHSKTSSLSATQPLPTSSSTSSSTQSSTDTAQLQSAQAAQAANRAFQSLDAKAKCDPSKDAQSCVQQKPAWCRNGSWTLGASCSAYGTQCFAVPSSNASSYSIGCYTEADVQSLISAAGGTGGVYGQTSGDRRLKHYSWPWLTFYVVPAAIVMTFA
ncbi:hypothetical protein FRB99_004103 [Tulasnella sp. 403]|nr:hypothetical protein FRB99_004103 [Tulasnella sp. 403]